LIKAAKGGADFVKKIFDIPVVKSLVSSLFTIVGIPVPVGDIV
jgi:hypothetical protein